MKFLYSQLGMQQIVDITNAAVDRMFVKLDHIEDKSCINLAQMIVFCFLDISSMIAMNESMPEEECAAMAKNSLVGGLGLNSGGFYLFLNAKFPWLKYLSTNIAKSAQRLVDFDRCRNELYTKWLERYKNTSDKFSYMDRLNVVTAAEREAHGLWNFDFTGQTTYTFVTASFITSSTSLTILMKLLAQNPNIQEQAATENKLVLGSHLPTKDDEKKMPFHQAAILETQRFASLVTMISRKATEDTTIGPYRIPKGN